MFLMLGRVVSTPAVGLIVGDPRFTLLIVSHTLTSKGARGSLAWYADIIDRVEHRKQKQRIEIQNR
jgi:hypothetical protein